MKIKSLSTKIILITSSIILTTIVFLVIYFINTTKKHTLEYTTDQILSKTDLLKLGLQSLVDEAFLVLENENQNIMMLEENSILTKQTALDLVKINLKNNPNFTGMCLIFEPNYLCKNDNSFPELMDKEKFIPYLYYNEDLSIGMEALIGYDVPGDGDYYLIPKQTKKPLLTEPYQYPVNGKIVYMITLVDVMLKNNEFIGISTADYDIKFMKEYSKNVKNSTYDGNIDISIVSNEGNLVVNTDDSTLVGKNIIEIIDNGDEMIQSIKNGEKEIFFKDGYLVVNEPVKFGKTDNYWRIQFSIPEEFIYKKIKQQTKIIITIGMMFFIISIILIYIFVQKFISPIKKLSDASVKLASGNFNIKIETSGNDEVSILSHNFKKMVDNFKNVILNIKETADAVLNASTQLSSSSESLSQNANEQSATTEQISTSMEQMMATVESNTEKAETTGKISNNSAKQIKLNNATFNEAINSVFEISKKIAVISEIASKTDILSINAAIEAAQAGDSGRGFAVVAQEIRKLADNSKAAALEIEKISTTSQVISKEAGEKLNQIIPEIVKSAELVDNIIIASKEQILSIESINNAILQLVEITNENSASAEELAASAEELSAQAEQLKEHITIFKV
ncbi:MAG: methyl-accepting chemotaxis protein [Bacteroidales bacterium]|nr:methyl-accepting chemotaxis protein [Bacteroidales bacterium]